MNTLQRIDAIDALLPQTQCGKCGHPGCRPYAEGIVQGEAINKCPPGGQATVQALAQLLDVVELPLEQEAVPAQIAFIREAECIGCTKCIQACPVDAIVGAAKLMHTVITDECTGCELCVVPCPVDCIDIIPLAEAEANAQRERADHFRVRHQAHLVRIERETKKRQAERAARLKPVQAETVAANTPASADEQKRLKIEAAMAKVVLAKAEQQLAKHGTAELAAQVEQLRAAATKAEHALAAASRAVPASATPLSLNQAKVQFAMRRAALDKATRQGADEATLSALRQDLEAASNALHEAQAATGKPAPDLVRTEQPGVDARLRELKTAHAYARADLQRLQRRKLANPESVTDQALAEAQQRFDQAQQQLNDHQAG